jgi:Domain of unknown function (DUF1929)/Putative peptidoglycan binding domain
MKYPRGYHSAAILLRDGSVFMGGDVKPFAGAAGQFTPSERYRPSYFFQPRPVITSAPASLAYREAFTITTPTPNSIAEVVLISAGVVTHAFNQNQRYVGCVINGASGTTLHVTAPPDGNVAPPGHYLLFLVDHDRIPSEGTWVWICPVLRRNSHGTMVGILQTMLRTLGVNLAIDQVFGNTTEGAVKDFQHTHNLNVDGIVGQHTWGALAKATP